MVHGNNLLFVIYCCTISEGSEIRLNSEHDGYKWVSRYEASILLEANFPDSLIAGLRK